ncbi:MAG TPA: heavy metal-binding domain-containing protein [Bryobacteraceae bacterium]|nr:heavy metal-binding domain-containing protein [Bryobacteraceae bacterium]
MLRLSALLIVAILCVMHAPAPDPRVVAARLANQPATPVPATGAPMQAYPDGDWVCPMDKDVSSNAPGFCPRCGMKLVEGVKDLIEFPIDLKIDPPAIRPGEDTVLTFGIVNPQTHKPVRDFEVVHEKLYHVFVVSQDLKFFLHTHPDRSGDEDFHLKLKFPHPGMYRVLSDFFPKNATPQLITSTVMVPGAGFRLQTATLAADVSPQTSENSHVEMTLVPEHPVAGQNFTMFFRISPDKDIQPYLGAPAHMLAASSDLIDMIHNHPFASADHPAAGYRQLQFNMNIHRAGVHRVWIQFQRQGVVNTVAFNVPVEDRL